MFMRSVPRYIPARRSWECGESIRTNPASDSANARESGNTSRLRRPGPFQGEGFLDAPLGCPIIATQHGDQRVDGCQSGSGRLLLAHRRWQFRENRLGQIETALQDADEGNFRCMRQVAPAQRLAGFDDRFGRRGCLDHMTETTRQGFRTTRFR